MTINIQNNPIALIIFGITGDLSSRKLIPALYELIRAKKISHPLDIIGFARRPWDANIIRGTFSSSLEEFARNKPLDINAKNVLLNNISYIQSTFDDTKGYLKLLEIIKSRGYKHIIYYLATPPDAYLSIISNLQICAMPNPGNHSNQRIVVEKPFGHDLATAIELETTLHKCFSEEQIFRIDHYLGKETVQNILFFRFANGIFEPLWNNHYIDHIQITVAETVGIGARAGYFENAGIIRDMFANHLLQLLTLTAMEAPFAFNADSVRDEKMKVLRSLRPVNSNKGQLKTIRAQYTGGHIDGAEVPGYLKEEKVSSSSITETYLALRLFIDNWRWAGVPFYIRSGKRMPERLTEVVIQFKQAPLSLFNWKDMAGIAPNFLTLRLQPDEGISLTFGAKQPGPKNEISPVTMDFCYQDSFGVEPPEAYERLLLDCIDGDLTLFTRTDEVIEQWRFTDEVIRSWESQKIEELPKYSAGTWGPQEAEWFLREDNRLWKNR